MRHNGRPDDVGHNGRHDDVRRDERHREYRANSPFEVRSSSSCDLEIA